MEMKVEIIEATNGFIISYGDIYIIAKGNTYDDSKKILREGLASLIADELLDKDYCDGVYDIKIEKHD